MQRRKTNGNTEIRSTCHLGFGLVILSRRLVLGDVGRIHEGRRCGCSFWQTDIETIGGKEGMIYVDSPIFPFRGQMYCHMATDGDLNELHQMASRIGLKPSWFQNKPGHPHYDLAPSKRALAIKYGAMEVSSIDMIRTCFRKGGEK